MTETAVEPKARPSYSEAQVTRALVEVAACSGNSHMAARNLEADDDAPSINQKTLWKWSRRDKLAEYERIRQEALPVITTQAAEQHMALARQQMELAQAAAGFVAARLDKMDDKDLVNAMGKADIGSGIHTEKAQLLSGQATSRVAVDLSGTLKELRSLGIDPEIVIDAEVVDESSVVDA